MRWIIVRSRTDTSQRILDAAFDVLASDGFAAFGVNSVARAARCDKKLIYRYFDGIDGLWAAMGQSAADRLVAALDGTAAKPATSYGALMTGLALALFDHLATDAQYRQIKIVEMAAEGGIAAQFRATRGQALGAWMQARRGDLVPPPGVDAAALNALLIVAVEGAAVALGGGTGLAGIAPGPVAQARIRDAVVHLIGAVYPS